MSAEVSFYSRGGSVPSSLKAQVTATYLANSGWQKTAVCFTIRQLSRADVQ